MENLEIRQALQTLQKWTCTLGQYAGRSKEDSESLWNRIKSYPDILREYASLVFNSFSYLIMLKEKTDFVMINLE